MTVCNVFKHVDKTCTYAVVLSKTCSPYQLGRHIFSINKGSSSMYRPTLKSYSESHPDIHKAVTGLSIVSSHMFELSSIS
jgi:hypothetical protein